MTCLFIGIGLVNAQVSKVTGTVTSHEDGLPVVGASVLVKGTTVGTVTDIDGNFTITNVPSSAGTLVVSFIGMKSQEVAVKPVVNVVLHSDAEMLDEVVVTAYGTQAARTVTASISSVRSDALKDVPNTSFDQMLQGRASGLNITTPSAGVGQAPVVYIRGVNSISSGTQPLYVVDGMPIQSGDLGGGIGNANALADINPADILSIDVLKDAAAAAMYGSRAANGVVLITTKQGSSGKVKVTYDASFGFSTKTKFIDVMNAQEYVDFKNMALRNAYGTDKAADLNAINSELWLPTTEYGDKGFNIMPGVDTNWSEGVFQNGFTQDQTVGISGGNDRVKYYMSANYNTQKGIVLGDNYKRLGGKANIVANATKWLKLGLNTGVNVSTTSQVDAARNGSSFAVGGFPRLALVNAPNLPMYDENGNGYYDESGYMGYGPNAIYNTFSNPVALSEVGNNTDVDVTRILNSFFAEITPIKGLTIKTQYNIDDARIENSRFWSPKHGDGLNYGGYAVNVASRSKLWTWTNTATYDFTVKGHHFNLLAGIEATETSYSYWMAERMGILDSQFTDFQAPFSQSDASGDISKSSMASYLGRINYDFNSKYMFSVNFRRDGLSALSEENRWGNFGGVSAAWRLSEENFFEPLKAYVDDFKIKASYGVVGNTNISDYASRSYYTSYYYGNNGTYGLSKIADANLKWETSEKYDAGFSARLMDRINVDFDYFYTLSSDLILDVPQAPSKGMPGNILTTNAGKMKNYGVELTVSADILKDSEFKWFTSFNITTAKNEVVSLADGLENILGMDENQMETTNITIPGKSIGQLYLYPTGGIDKETGRRIFYGTNGEKVLYKHLEGFINPDGTPFEGELSPVACGNTLPTWYGGWSNTFTYKNFDLSLFFQFSGGNYIYNGTKATVSDMRFWNNSKDVLNNYWTPERKEAKYPIPVYGDNISNGSAMPISDLKEKGDYLRFKNISLGYTFDTRKWAKSIGISKLRLYAQAQNLFVITGYSGMDPEVMTNTTNATLAPGTDKNTLPQARTFTFGVNLAF